jgi:hypothetical protein
MSLDDRKALDFEEANVIEKDRHLEIAMPWRVETSTIPNNKPAAEKRLVYLKRKFEGNPSFKEKYAAAMKENIDAGYAEGVPPSDPEPDSGVWYIPHHGVLNQHKPKLRIVFDCAAKFRGKSLNDYLYQGPDLMNSLIGILMRFREKAIPIAADIKAMFSQVRASPNDHDLQRFLWFPDGDTRLQPQRFRMTRHIFGATSSPFVAAYALRKAAKLAKDAHVRAAILKDFYVDDLLTSCDTEEDAVTLGLSLIPPLKKLGSS